MKLLPFKRKKLFGNNIIPSCEYCQRANNIRFKEKCSILKKKIAIENCRHFIYNPLKRTPINGQSFKKNIYSHEDFRL